MVRWGTWPRLVLALLLALATLGALPTPQARAAERVVTKAADTADGVCDADCSLREAVAVAGNGDTIVFAAGVTAAVLDSSLTIGKQLTIDGQGVVALARPLIANPYRILTITATVHLIGLTIRNGRAGIGAGINNAGFLTLTNVTVTSNTASDLGGGIYSGGPLTLINSRVGGNAASNAGGGIYSTSPLTLTNSVIDGNTAGNGGGLANFAAATLTDTTISGNTASGNTAGNGGGIYNSGSFANVTVVGGRIGDNRANQGGGIDNAGGGATLTSSAIVGNSARFDGGGLHNANIGQLIVSHSTLSGNSAEVGGGIRNFSGSLTVLNSTVSGNSARYGGGLSSGNSSTDVRFSTISDNRATAETGGIVGTSGTRVRSSIVVGNVGGAGQPSDCGAGLTSQGRNVWGDQADCPNNVGLGDQNLAALNLTPAAVLAPTLAENGGPTQTHTLVPGSPAIDGGDNTTCAAPTPNGPQGADQRGVARPQGAGCDAGAVELRHVPLAVGIVGAGTVSRNPVGGGGGPYGYPLGTVVELVPLANPNQVFTGWTVDGVNQGWPVPLTITMNDAHTVQATFVPRASFPDLPPERGDYVAIVNLASRGTIKGYQDGRYGPDDKVRRDQMAALIARAMPAGPGVPPQTLTPPACLVAGSWDCENWGNTFSDRGGVDANLWRNAGTMQHYGVSIGYAGATCAAKRVPSPCYGPGDNVTYAQTISFITRAMKAKGYWVDQPGAPLVYQNVPPAHQLDVRTFHFYTGALGGVPAAPTTLAGWEAGATRGWFARALWHALDSYWKVDRVP